jgi:hypothetical protein
MEAAWGSDDNCERDRPGNEDGEWDPDSVISDDEPDEDRKQLNEDGGNL